MVQVIQAGQITLPEVEARFNLRRVADDDIFPEWRESLPPVTDEEKHWLDKVRDDFLSLNGYPSQEECPSHHWKTATA